MRKFFIFCLFFLFTVCVSGEEIFISQPGEKEGKSCQAVRIKDNWFLTAAHCVADICNISCKAEMQIDGQIIETTQKNISWLNERRGNKASYDIALINFKDAKIKEKFKEPQILIIDDFKNFTEPKILNRNLEIPFNFGGSAGQIMSVNDVFYGPKSKTVFTRDLGLFHGLSGSGVLTDKGELIAITSAIAGQGENIRFSVFAVFDGRVESFLRQKGPLLYFKHADISDFKDTANFSEEYKEILTSLDNDR